MTATEAGLLVDGGDFSIRQETIADGVDDYLWRRDPETSRFDGSGGGPGSLGDFLAALEADLSAVFPRRRWFALVDRKGKHFGTIVLTGAAPEASVGELGITIGQPQYRDRGIGTRATVGVLRYLWQTTRLRRVELHTFEWNERAHRCFLKAGFQDVARVIRGDEPLLRMEARREWWQMWDGEGRFAQVRCLALSDHP